MATTPTLTDQAQTPAPVPVTAFGGKETQGIETDVLKDRKDLQEAAKALCKYFIGLDKWVRRQEVVEARRQRFYWRNEQYIYWKSDAVGFITAQGGQSLSVDNQEIQIPRYTDVYNIYTPYGESILSTLIQNSPGINWQPLDSANPNDITASKTAEKYQQKIENDNDRKSIQSDVARFFFTDGRTSLYTRRNKDGYEQISAHGVLETKVVPITANSIKELISFTLSDELDIYQAKDEYPDYADNIKENSATMGESAYERIARLGVLQGTKMLMQAGDAFSHMVSRHVFFLRTSTFRKVDEKLRDEIKSLFPDGMKITFCGDTYCASENVAMDEQITVDFPTPGDGMSRPSLGKRVVPLQDVFNDELNLWHEAHDYCVPTLFMYSETGDIEAVREQISEPGGIVPFSALPPGASSAESAFYAAVLEGIPATLPQLIQFIQGPLSQFISGAFPALFGGDTGDNDTAKGISIQRDQAMGRMGIAWGAIQRLFAGAYTNAVMSVVKNSSAEDNFSYSITDKTGAVAYESISVEDLREGTAICKADSDATFPESTNAKRQTYLTMMTAAERNPILAGVMSDPNNLEFGHDIIGLTDLVVPGAESRNKQLIEIRQLLAEVPIPPSMQEVQQASVQNPQLLAAMTQWEQAPAGPDGNKPAPPIPPELYSPSVKVDPEFDNHPVEYAIVADWLSGEDRRREEQKGNIQGIQNVRLHGLQHKANIPPPMPPPAKGGATGTQAAAPALHAAAPQTA
jgi:hypothetical protein